MNIQPISSIAPAEIAVLLAEGKTIVYPTETCYGLGADATHPMGVDSIFTIKKRQKEKTVLVIMSDIAMVKEYVHWNEHAAALADRYWPGPLTLVLHAKHPEQFPAGIVKEDGTLAVRVTEHPFAQALVRALGKPIVSTSANIASMESPYDIDAIRQMFTGQKNQPDLVLDAGDLPHKAPSTICRVDERGVHVLRQGDLIIAS